jgi:hypothetical protein
VDNTLAAVVVELRMEELQVQAEEAEHLQEKVQVAMRLLLQLIQVQAEAAE